MKNLYIDCQYGLAGDMMLASLLDLGADPVVVAEQLEQLDLHGYHMTCDPIMKNGIRAKQVNFHLQDGEENFLALQAKGEYTFEHHDGEMSEKSHHSPHEHHHAREIIDLLEKSSLSNFVKEKSVAIFQEIARAESKIHGIPIEDVHFHEVGALDSILDIVGVCVALEDLSIEKIFASPVAVGHGLMHMAHGLFPVPAPATLEILKSEVPVSDFSIDSELTTPTGAAFLKVLVDDFIDFPTGVVESIGYGAGQKDFAHPNVVRTVLLGKEEEIKNSYLQEKIIVMECQIDDMTPEALSDVVKRLISMPDVYDAYLTPITMKKSRLGQLLTILSSSDQKDCISDFLLQHTTTFGIRYQEMFREKLERFLICVHYLDEEIHLKVGKRKNQIIKIMPENDDVARVAEKSGQPFYEIYQAAQSLGQEWLKKGERYGKN